jgi:two-component system, NarL family, nitrate/nitrite response regulator NarL
MPKMNYSVFLLCPNLIAREGLSRIIQSEGFEVVAAWSSANEMDFERLNSVDLGIIDVSTPETQIGWVHVIKSQMLCKTVVLADSFDGRTMLECFSHGADGYIVKNMACSTLVALLRLAVLGHKIMPSELPDHLTREMLLPPQGLQQAEAVLEYAKLSEREQTVLQCLIAGDPNKTIGRKLDITETTVKVHVKAIMRKLNVLNRTQAAMWAKSRGLDQPHRGTGTC